MSPALLPTDAGSRALPRSVLLLLLAVYVATFAGPALLPDGEVSFQTTSALARRGSFAMGGTPEVEDFLRPQARREGTDRIDSVRVLDGGERLYGWFGVGQALVAVPLYAAGAGLGRMMPAVEEAHTRSAGGPYPRSEYWSHLVVGLRNPLLAAWTAALLAATCLRLGVGRRAAWWLAMAYGLTTFAWPQARSCLSDVQATFFLFAAFHLLIRLRDKEGLGRPPRRRALVGLGALLAAAVLTRVALAPAALAVLAAAEVELCVGYARRPGHEGSARRALLWVGLPLVVAALAFAWWNHARFGAWDDSGYGPAIDDGLFRIDPRPGLMGLLLSPGRGLIWMAPLVVLAPLGFHRMHGRGERLAVWVPLFVFAVTLCVAAFMEGWHGAWTYGPRYLLPALPFLFIGVGQALSRLGDLTGGRVLLGGLVLFGVWTQLPAALVDTTTYHELVPRVAAADPASPDRNPDQVLEAALWDLDRAPAVVHWRILRHRLAEGDDRFLAGELLGGPEGLVVVPEAPRARGFRHLGWVDAHQRLGVPLWPVLLLLLALVALGTLRAGWALDRKHR